MSEWRSNTTTETALKIWTGQYHALLYYIIFAKSFEFVLGQQTIFFQSLQQMQFMIFATKEERGFFDFESAAVLFF